jgi:hypothetical protein
MSVEVDVRVIDKAVKALGKVPNAVEQATAAALNRAVIAGRTAVSKGVREHYTIRASDIKGQVCIKRAAKSSLEAAVTISGSPIDLTNFRVRISRRGAYAQVKKGSGGILPRSFFMAVGKAGLYHRASESRLPIQREFGPSVPQMAGETNVSKGVQERMQEVFQTRFEHEVMRRLEVME